MASDAKRPHHIHRFTTERRKDGQKVVRYAFSCTPHDIHGAEFESKAQREKAIGEHGGTRQR